MLTHARPQLHCRCSSTWTLRHSTKASIIGQLWESYSTLGNNTHPECAYAFNACACCCVSPHQAHGNTLKKIGCCLKGVLDDGLIIDPKGDLSLDCYVDADFAGNCNAKEVDNPSAMRSRTGFIITLGSVPVLWKSVVQSEITLSTVEAECIALSTVRRKLIQL